MKDTSESFDHPTTFEMWNLICFRKSGTQLPPPFRPPSPLKSGSENWFGQVPDIVFFYLEGLPNINNKNMFK